MKKRRFIRLFTFLLVIFFIISSFYTLPYYVSKPGMAKELAPIIHVENGYEEEGSFMLTTVRMGRANIYSYALAKLNDYQKIFPLEVVRSGDESEEEYNVRQLYLMDNSKLSAIEVAYKKAGIEVGYDYKGVYVLNVVEDMPADGKLQAGDRIFQVDDLTFASSQEFIDYVSSKQAYDEITLKYERSNEEKTVAIQVKPFANNDQKVGIGIGLVDDKKIKVEPNITIETSDIGGPSAGFMFSLEIYNQLTADDLTRGYDIAGTGTISPDGKIGRIGGIEQKIVAASKAKADIFFAPFEDGAAGSNYEEALKTAEDIKTEMTIVPVNTFDEAIAYLENLTPKK